MNLKKTLQTACMAMAGLLLCVGSAGATPVLVQLKDLGLGALNAKITFTPTNDVLVTTGGLSAGPPVTTNTPGGTVTINLDKGDYWVSLPLIPNRRAFVISVYDTNVVVNITNLLAVPRTYTYTNNLDWTVKASGIANDSPGVLGAKIEVAGGGITKGTNGANGNLILTVTPGGGGGGLSTNDVLGIESTTLSDLATNFLNTYIAPSWGRLAGVLHQNDLAGGPPSAPFMLVSIGDSVATETTSSLRSTLFPEIYRTHERKGGDFVNTANSHRAFLTGTAATLGPDANWFSAYYALNASATMFWSNDLNSAGSYVSKVYLYWIQHANGGTFRLQASANNGAYTDIASLSGNNATIRGAFTNLSVAQNYYKFKVVSDTGPTNYIIGMGDRWNGINSGFVEAVMAYPGIALANITNVPHSIRDVVLTNLFTDTSGGLILLHMKENGSVATDLGLREVNQWINLTTNLNVSAVWVGSPAVGGDTNAAPPVTLVQNYLIKSNAVVSGISFFDAYKYFGSYTNAEAAGMFLDAVHPTAAANAILAQGFMKEFGLNDLPTSLAWPRAPTSFAYHGLAGSPVTLTYGTSGGGVTYNFDLGIRMTGTPGDLNWAFSGDANSAYINLPSGGSGSVQFQSAGLGRVLGRAYLSGGWYLGGAGSDPGLGNVTVAGTAAANLFSGSGASLNTLNASQLTSGTTGITRGGTGQGTAAAGFDALSQSLEITLASAATTDLGAQNSQQVSVTGTTTITSFGTVAAGTIRYVRFTGALTLTHNASSLILPGNASITTAAGDRLVARSEGSGNWRVWSYTKADGTAITGGAGGGDFSSNTGTSVDSEVVLFSGTGGKTGKRATGSGIPKLASGVLGFAAAGTDYVAPSTTLTINGTALDLSANRTFLPTTATPQWARLGLGAAADATFEYLLEADGLGVTVAHGELLRNQTAAAAGAQQFSPATFWEGRGWKTGGTPGSQAVAYRAYVSPVQGSANPTGLWNLESQVNGGSWLTGLQVSTAGDVTAGGGLVGNNLTDTGVADNALLKITAGTKLLAAAVAGTDYVAPSTTLTINGTALDLSANRTFLPTTATPQWARLGLGVAADATFEFIVQADALGATPNHGAVYQNTTAAAAGAQQWSPAIIQKGKGWKTTATAASQDVASRFYVEPVQGAANPSGIWHLDLQINGGSWLTGITVDSAGNFSAGAEVAGNSMRDTGLADNAMVKVTAGTKVLANATAGTDYTSPTSTETFQNKTYDTGGTGNIFKMKQYLPLTYPHIADGTGAIITTNGNTTSPYAHAIFSGSAAASANWIEYRTTVPEDIDTAVDLRARFWFKLKAADTGAHTFHVLMASTAASAGEGTPANSVTVSVTGDASGANNDLEDSGWVTLTNWKSNVTAGQPWVIRVDRDGVGDASTQACEDYELKIEYGVSQ